MHSGELAGIHIQPRDVDVLRGLFESRVMTLAHISALHFAGKKEMAKKRLQKLKAAGLIRERPRRTVADPGILFIARSGFRFLSVNGHLADYPQITELDLERRVAVAESKLRHELEVMDVKAALVSSIQDMPAFQVEEFATWPRLYEFESCNPSGRAETTQPDGCIRLIERTSERRSIASTFFLEVDRSTSAPGVLADRVHCYGDFYRSGGFATRCGASREERKNFGFRVLIVCKSEERRNNIAAKLLLNSPPVHTLAWLTTAAEITTKPTDPIWIRPIDYQTITVNTRFDPFRTDARSSYRTDAEREAFVARAIQKHSIFSA